MKKMRKKKEERKRQGKMRMGAALKKRVQHAGAVGSVALSHVVITDWLIFEG